MVQTDILCVGAVLWDVVGRSQVQMQIGSDVPGRIARIPGGVALNIAMALKVFQLAPALLGAVGKDPAGDELIDACKRLGLSTEYLYRSDELPTDQYMAIEGANGVVAAIADAHSLEMAGENILTPLISGELKGWARTIALDGNLTQTLLTRIASDPAFEAADLRIAPASPGKAERLRPFLGHKSATLYVNLIEAGSLLGRECRTSWEAAQFLLETGIHRVLVTDGPNTATAAIADSAISLKPPEVLVKRVTGAGDTFMAAHIAAEHHGRDSEEALSIALDAAARYISGEKLQ